MRIILLSLIGLSIISCGEQQSELDENFSWLLGSWEQKEDGSTYVETWQKVNDTLYSAQSMMYSQTDTFFQEKIQLYYSKEKFVYAPAVNNQNDGKAIPFSMIESSEEDFTFKNSAHDFPQFITYLPQDVDSLKVTVCGMEDDEFKSLIFRLARKH